MVKLQKSPATRRRPRPPPNPRLGSRRESRRRISGSRILERLTSGLSGAHIARAEKLGVRRAQQLRIARPSEARTMTMEGNLPAMDRLIELTSELDRYPASRRPIFPGRRTRRFAAPQPRSISPNPARGEVGGKFSASQSIGIARNREGISESSRPRRAGASLDLSPNPARGEVEGKFSASQLLEIAQNREGISR
jgi:hypothetical protein